MTPDNPWNFGRDVIDRYAQERPDALALSMMHNDTNVLLTFQDISRLSGQTADWLKAQGIGKGDRVLIVLGKDPAFWPVMVALNKLGAVAMPGTTQLTAKDLLYRLQVSQATSAIVLPEIADKLQDEALHLTHPIVVGGARPHWISFDPYHLDNPVFEGFPTDSSDPTLIYFTSGTTGYPKMVLHNQRYPEAHTITAQYWLGLSQDDLHWNISDTGWAKAAWSSLFGPWMVGAAIFVDNMTGKFDPQQFLHILSTHPITSVCAPPTVYRLVVKEDLSLWTFPHLKSAVSAGEPLNPEVIQIFKQATGLDIRDGYGQTETVLLIGNTPGQPIKPGSMGRPAPEFEMTVIDHQGVPLPPGQEGDIAIKVHPKRPRGLFQGYVNDAEGTQKRFVGDYYITGDRAIVDEDGYFWFVGRADDVIISSGYRIGPFEVESLLVERPEVLEAAVVSSPDPIRGEIVKAFVVLKPGIEPSAALAETLQNHVKTQTAPYKYPRAIEFVTDLPKTVSGKIRRIELRQKEWEKAKRPHSPA
ncbi:acyl--CoA ligase [Sulfobacillus thermosulfidooxidans]|uniref:acyl--CoA ligase n=1 Tax=Sulfobacillus thermosulfidooxidans TaxID=28034 RepID=UPI00040FE96F|nr:acyl--CoA ligase [Sulfobacillus thermosulfidooxidans]